MTDAFVDAIGRDPSCRCPACRMYGAYAPGAEDYLGRLAREMGTGDRFAHQHAAEALAAAFISLAGALLIRAHTMTDECVQHVAAVDCHRAHVDFEQAVGKVRTRFERLVAVMQQIEGRE